MGELGARAGEGCSPGAPLSLTGIAVGPPSTNPRRGPKFSLKDSGLKESKR